MDHFGQFILNHWQLWLAFLIILLLLLINESLQQKKKAKELSPQAAVDLMNNEHAVIIDLRDKAAFNQGHIIGSIHVKKEEFIHHKMDKYKNKSIILVCARGIESQSLANKMRSQGFQALVLSGGIAAWQSTDLPLVKEK